MNWSMTCLLLVQRDLGVDSAPVSLNKTRRATLKSRAFFCRPKKLVTRFDRSESDPQKYHFKKNEKSLNGIKTNRVLDIITFTTFVITSSLLFICCLFKIRRSARSGVFDLD